MVVLGSARAMTSTTSLVINSNNVGRIKERWQEEACPNNVYTYKKWMEKKTHTQMKRTQGMNDFWIVERRLGQAKTFYFSSS